VTPLVKGEEPSCLTCAYVGFQPGARSAWHTHPKGQLLIVTDGGGLIQEWGKPVRRIVKGDVIWTPPAVKHWHGASPDTAMTHTACQEMKDGRNVDWMEKVTDEEYGMTPPATRLLLPLERRVCFGRSAAAAIRMAEHYGQVGNQALREAADVLGAVPPKFPGGTPKSPQSRRKREGEVCSKRKKEWLLR
jgi:quercetin dioxygenase-like cupin family protein